MRKLVRHLRRFQREDRGAVTVEFLIVFPLLVWAYVAMWVFFDMMRVAASHQKAAYVISDMLSRETDYITPTYIDNTKSLFDYLMVIDRDNAIRISSIGYDDDTESYEVVWSQARGDQEALETSDIADWDDQLPLLAAGDELILVETWYRYHISFSQIDLDDIDLHNFVYTRPRFAAVLKYSETGS